MRTIKFRGRNEKGEWFYGGFAYQHFADEYDNGQPTQGFTTVAAIFNDEPGNRNGSYWHTVAEHTVGQYTGLKDADGKEIYEGDILLLNVGHIGEGGENVEYTGCFVYDVEYAGFMLTAITGTGKGEIHGVTQEYVSKFGMRIIGNIHDNPELL